MKEKSQKLNILIRRHIFTRINSHLYLLEINSLKQIYYQRILKMYNIILQILLQIVLEVALTLSYLEIF